MSHPFEALDDAEVLAMFDWLAGVYKRDGLSRDAERVRAIAALVQRRERRAVPLFDAAGSVPGSWVTVGETSGMLGIGERAVVKRIHRGTLAAVQLPDDSWRVDPDSIDVARSRRAGRVDA